MSKELSNVEKQETALASMDFGEHAGVGFENVDSSHLSVPFLGVLQDLSPEVNKKRDEYVEGAEPGMMINTVTKEIMKSPVCIVPCATEHMFVEWTPRNKGGGLVASHEPGSAYVQEVRSLEGQKFGKLVTADGNDLIETFYIYALLLSDSSSTTSTSPIVISCSSTKIKEYKRLMTKLRTIKGRPPMYAFRIAVTTKDETNKSNQPYSNISFAPAVNNSLAESANLPGTEFEGLLSEGQALTKAFRTGTAKAAVETQQTGSSEDAEADEVFI